MRSETTTLPIATKSEANRRDHWRVKARRTKEQRSTAAVLLRCYLGPCPAPPSRVTLTRIAPRDLDDDNLVSALKAVRDGVQDWSGIDDRKLRVAYEQRRGKPNEYAVEVRIEWDVNG